MIASTRSFRVWPVGKDDDFLVVQAQDTFEAQCEASRKQGGLPDHYEAVAVNAAARRACPRYNPWKVFNAPIQGPSGIVEIIKVKGRNEWEAVSRARKHVRKLGRGWRMSSAPHIAPR